tara:strand:- start:307 stop:609 length:303 start_codon:yes stop_codon:yes gene_type:complete
MKPARDKEGNPEMCEECGFPMIIALNKGRRPWKLCFNSECKTNEEAQKKKAEFKEKLASGEIEIGEDGKVIDHSKKKGKKVAKKKKGKTKTKATKKKKKS